MRNNNNSSSKRSATISITKATVLLLMFTSSFVTAFAFAASSSPLSVHGATATVYHPCSSSAKRQGTIVLPASLRLKGGGSGSQNSLKAASSAESTPRQESLAAIKNCYLEFLLYATVDAATQLLDDPSVSGLFELAYVAFGVGLWVVSQCYETNYAAYQRNPNRMGSFSALRDLMRVYRGLYFATAWAVVGMSMRLADKIMLTHGILAVVGAVAAAGAVYKRMVFQKMANEAIAKETANGGMELKRAGETRNLGVSAAWNMALCSGSFLLYSVISFFFWATVVIPSPSVSFYSKYFTVLKFLVPLALSGLMEDMDKRFLDATIEVTTTSANEERQGVFSSLMKAESDFYRKASKLLISSSILDILRILVPAIISVIKEGGIV